RTLASLRKALKPGGRLVVVDFDRVKGKSTEFVLKHVRADRATFAAEIRAAGFLPDPVANPPGLTENFFLRFRKNPKGEAGSASACSRRRGIPSISSAAASTCSPSGCSAA